MSQSTEADLKDFPALYESSREVGDVLIREDDARPVIKACSSGNDATLQSLLSHSEWDKTMLLQTHNIYSEDRPSKGPDDVRGVSAMRMSHLERAFETAAKNGHAACVSTLLSFAKRQGIEASKLVHRLLLYRVIMNGHAAVVRELVSAYPDIIHTQIAHGAMPLYEAVIKRRTDIVAVLFELGADPTILFDEPERSRAAHAQLMSRACLGDPRLIEMLVERDVPIAGTRALHTAAKYGKLDNMRVLIEHGADVNAPFDESNWTPMHWAASSGRVEAMKLLEEHGARVDVADAEGKTPKQLLEEHENEK